MYYTLSSTIFPKNACIYSDLMINIFIFEHKYLFVSLTSKIYYFLRPTDAFSASSVSIINFEHVIVGWVVSHFLTKIQLEKYITCHYNERGMERALSMVLGEQ